MMTTSNVDEGLDRELEARRVPDRAEIRSLLETYFDGPITDAHVTTIADRIAAMLADPARRTVEDHTYIANSVRNHGQAWKEVLSKGQSAPRVIDYVPWFASITKGFPPPKPHCPRELVGTWEQVEPPGGRWELRADGGFHADVLDDRERWYVRERGGKQRSGDELYVREADGSDIDVMHIVELTPSTLRVTLIGGAFENQDFRLRRVA